jgi:hypothetical protein
MSKEFTPLTRAQFDDYLAKFKWTRQITNVHMHHTWQPNHAQWQGLKSVRGMYDYHTRTNGWSDIAQHVTIAPDGIIWLGRNWNKSPASSNGFNGNNLKGPFMFETVGNFDKGKDKLEGEQLKSVLHVIAAIQENRKLQTENLKFHRHLNSPKTCPGSGVSYDDILDQVDVYKKQMKAPPHVSMTAAPTLTAAPKRSWWKGWWRA